MRQELCFCLLGRYLAFIECLKTFGKVIDIRVDETCFVYNDSKIHGIRETRIEDIDILKVEKISGSFRSFYHWNGCWRMESSLSYSLLRQSFLYLVFTRKCGDLWYKDLDRGRANFW